MGAICNGMALHGGLRPYCATFLVFSDYMRPAVRMAALMGQPVIYLFTHDSVYLGEDGPTHQPGGAVGGLAGHPQPAGVPAGHHPRSGTGLVAGSGPHRRPHGPGPDPPKAAGPARRRRRSRRLCPGRLRHPAGSRGQASAAGAGRHRQRSGPGLVRGGATGEGRHGVRVVSMPCRELFLEQPAEYREQVLGGPERAPHDPGGRRRCRLGIA